METGAVGNEASVFHFALLLGRKEGAETCEGQTRFGFGQEERLRLPRWRRELPWHPSVLPLLEREGG